LKFETSDSGDVIVTTPESVIALYEECRDYRQMHRDIYGGDEYTDQLDFWTRTEIKEFGRLVRLDRNSSMLDVGCGLGGPACLLARTFNAKVMGIDLSEWHINESRAAAARLGLGDQINFSVFDARSFDGGGMQFDAVVAIDSIVYMHPLGILFHGLRRLLKPTARMLLASECFDHKALANVLHAREKAGAMKCIVDKELQADLTESGFRIESISRDYERRRRFAKQALQWMDLHKQHAGRENMTAILNACETGGAFEVLIVAQAR
jgi:cyclopropane fatty-acyl-phospholipid synthase-like methyltransferase